MRPPLTTFSGELVGSAAAATREDAPRRGGSAGGVPPVGRRRRRPSGAGCSVRLSCSSLHPAPLLCARRGDARTRLGRLHCVGPKRRAGQINAVNTMPAVGPPPASPKPRRASSASRATAACLSSSPRSVASSTPPRPRRPPLLAPRALTAQDGRRRSIAVGTSSGNWARCGRERPAGGVRARGTIRCSASRTGPRRADDHGRICGAGTGSGRQRERMTAAMRAMGELDAQDQGEVLRYVARLPSKHGRP
jgi:hypothetical protein